MDPLRSIPAGVSLPRPLIQEHCRVCTARQQFHVANRQRMHYSKGPVKRLCILSRRILDYTLCRLSVAQHEEKLIPESAVTTSASVKHHNGPLHFINLD
jgi:hypothetical protein